MARLEGSARMKRVIVITTFASFSPDYSLVSVVADQLRMLTRHGYTLGLAVQEDFRDDDKVPEGVNIHKVLPVISLHDYAIGETARPDFEQNVARVVAGLSPILDEYDVAITHDLMFLSWFLPHNEAVRQLAREHPKVSWLHWIHSAPSVRPAKLTYPHILRFSMPPNSKLVYLNNNDTLRLAEMYGTSLEQIRVVPNTKDPGAFFDLHPLVQRIIDRFPLLTADVVSVLPFSTPRWEGKNVQKLIWLMAKIKQQGKKVLLVLVNAHCNADKEKRTVQDLLQFAFEKGLSGAEICFTSTLGEEWEYSVPNDAVRQLFQLSNVFIFPSLSECCSLVLLEAALCKNLLVLNRDVPSMREFGGEKALYPQFGSVQFKVTYQNEDGYWADWAKIIQGALNQERALDSFRHVIGRHNLDWIFKNTLEPLFHEP